MPIKLNPCRSCGSKRHIVWKEFPSASYSVQCAKCGNHTKEHAAHSEDEADAAWNAANPKEGNPDAKNT